MKKIICAGLACMMAFSLAGCGNKTTSSPMDGGEEVEAVATDTTQYEVIKEMDDDFDITPSNDYLGKEGYMVKVDGKCGFIDSNGEYVMAPEYDYVQLYLLPDENMNLNTEDCMFFWKNEECPGDSLAYALGNSDEPKGGAQIGGIMPPVFINADNEVYQAEYPIGSTAKPYSIEENLCGVLLPKVEDINELLNPDDSHPYYIVLPNGKMFGPYDADENPSFLAHNAKESGYFVLHLMIPVYGPFYEKTDDGYVIWNEDGTKNYADVVDSATPISFTAMKIEKDGKMGVIDKDLNLVLFGDFEDVTLPIDGHAFVKMDGSWKFIEIQ